MARDPDGGERGGEERSDGWINIWLLAYVLGKGVVPENGCLGRRLLSYVNYDHHR